MVCLRVGSERPDGGVRRSVANCEAIHPVAVEGRSGVVSGDEGMLDMDGEVVYLGFPILVQRVVTLWLMLDVACVIFDCSM